MFKQFAHWSQIKCISARNKEEEEEERKVEGGFNLLSGLQVQDICHTNGFV